ncbi:MAG: DegT/DnrJ/EryC1/StrS family aminotransferase [Cytophagia bacterium]|nr:DegT/DnrJ/EryC1/StrS family aminotransferase [Cytophagia bacterium]NBW34985.1 DegT/DnrJ/EryC1/StrS family aminotransferase [Cytophagia bacterium]
MDKIVMVDLHTQYLSIKDEIDQAIQEVLKSTSFIQGEQVQQFAQLLAKYNDVEYVVPCANGTDALQIAMMALDYKSGDEIILPVHTYVATAEVIALLGLTPVFTEVDGDTFNIDVNQLENKITPRTRAIVPVHLYGQCADMEPLLKIAKQHNLDVIEDTAQALGAIYTFSNGKKMRAGTIGTIGTTSFFPSKNLGCYGDGGALFTRDERLAKKIKMIANHGQSIKYQHDIIGVNSRLDTLQAAILKVKLQYLDQYTEARNKAADFYSEQLKKIKSLQIPARAKNSTHVFHQYTLKISDGKRDELKKHLEDKGVPTMIYYPIPLHLQKAYSRDGFGEGSFPLTESLSKEVLSLPIHTEMKEEQLNYIVNSIKEFFS